MARFIPIFVSAPNALAEREAFFIGIVVLLLGRMFAQSDIVIKFTTVTAPNSSLVARLGERRFILTMLICAVLYLPSLAWTLGLDQNIFAEIASLLLKGKRLYVDAWDVKPPNVFYTYTAFEWLFGASEFAVRLSDYTFTLLAAAALFVGVDERSRMYASERADWIAPVAAILLTLTLLSLGSADTAQTESYSLFFIITSALLAFRRRTLSLLCAGALLSIAAFFKTTNALFFLPIIIEVLAVRGRKSLRPLILFAIGLVAWSTLQVSVLALQGSLKAYIEIAQRVAAHHADEISDFSFTHIWRILWVYVDVWLIVAIAGALCALLCKDRAFFRIIRLPFLYVLTGVLIVVVQNKGWGYHYVVLMPGLVALCTLSLISVLKFLRPIRRPVIVAVASLAVLGFWGKSIWRAMPKHNVKLAYLAVVDRPEYLNWFGRAHSLYHPPQTAALVNYIQSHSSAQDRVFIFGDEPAAYWHSDRVPATKFTYTLLFNSGVLSDEEIRELNDSLVSIKPRLIAVERFDTTGFRRMPETSVSTLNSDERFVQLRSLLSTHYNARDTVAENFIIYTRQD